MDDSGHRMAAFAGQFELAGDIPVELCPKVDQILETPRAFLDQYAHCVDLTESGSCSECVLQVQFDVGVGAGQRCGHPTLGPSGCGHIQGSLGQDRSIEAVHRVGAYGSGQACNP